MQSSTHSAAEESSSSATNGNNNNNDSNHGNSFSYDNISHHSDMGSLGGGSSNGGGGGGGNSTPFFADMTLDISVAHDIAETPEPINRKTFDANHPVSSSLPHFPTMPSLPELQQSNNSQIHNNNNNNSNTSTSRDDANIGNDNDDNDPSMIESHQPNHHQQQHPSSQGNPRKDKINISENGVYEDDFNDDNHVMARVTSDSTPGGRFRPFGSSSGGWRSRFRRRRWPKDVGWAIAFWLVVPIGLFVPLVKYGTGTSGGRSGGSSDASSSFKSSWLAAAASPRSATLHTLTWGLIFAAVLLPRFLYRTSGGIGVGDDARHFASQLLLASAPVSACVYLALLGATYFLLPSAMWPYGLIPLWYLARDLYLFRRWKMTATTPGGRQAFFQALACAALDILSRSLKRKALYRTVIVVIVGDEAKQMN